MKTTFSGQARGHPSNSTSLAYPIQSFFQFPSRLFTK
jgi:hypothetical protein